jgi:hypothetical protein
MNRACRQLTTSLGRPEHTLSEAERLLLERHLVECEACQQVSALSRTIADLVLSAPASLSESARERAIAGAFVQAARPAQHVPRAPWVARVGLSLALAAVVLLGLRSWFVRDVQREQSASVASAPPPSAVPAPRVAVTAPPTVEPVAEDWVEAIGPETHVFGSARVALAAGARVRFDERRGVLELARGQVTVALAETAPPTTRGQGAAASSEPPFVVRTQQGLRVVLLAAEARITPERVDVLRGSASVMRDEQLVRRIGAGESYLDGAPASSTREPRAGTRRTRESASELLKHARQKLAAQDAHGARELIGRAEQRATKRDERAEAGTLRAECALIEHQPEQALAAYLRVAQQFSELTAGENALYAAAQLSVRGDDEQRTRALFTRYLERYPDGRFALAARARLTALDRPKAR